MKLRLLSIALLFTTLLARPAAAAQRFIVRSEGGLPALQSVCLLVGCNVAYGLDGSLGALFLITTADSVDPSAFLATLSNQNGITNAEPDQVGTVLDGGIPTGLSDRTPIDYFSTTVWNGYAAQPASRVIRLGDAQSTFRVRGAGIVAVIDTGVEPNHPALKNILVSGYDFTRDAEGMPSERADLAQSTAAVVDGGQPVWVNASTVAVLDQSTAAVVDGGDDGAFGHGTMVAGIIHLVAPAALIMPLKAFRANGTGYLSDILRAIHFAVQKNANVINMSFSVPAFSRELKRAADYANYRGVVCVASAGNNGAKVMVYPAGLTNVMGVASTTYDDQRSGFSNYGQALIWVAAPGEAIISTYPFSTYAAGWGTSFSAPFVSGAAALLLDVLVNSGGGAQVCQANGASSFKFNTDQFPCLVAAVAYAKWISSDLGNGRLDLYQALMAWRQMLGLPPQ